PAIPAANTTYDPVHRLLLMGNDQFHISPTIIAIAPAAKRPQSRSSTGRRSEIQRPARLPSSAVETAPDVDRIPSGSHVRLLIQTCFVSNRAAMYKRKR